jgi:hypothetical protein
MHTDAATIPQNDALITSAQARGVPIVSGKQMVTWIDGRNASSYGDVAWSANTLTFKVLAGAGATGLTGMLPTAGPNGTQLSGVTRGGSAVTIRTETVKGLEYAIFSASAGSYTASYSAPAALNVAALSVDTGPAVADQTASLEWTTTSVATSEISLGTSATKLTTTKAKRDATRKHSVSVTGLEPGTRYYYRVTSRDAKGVARTSPALTEAPASFVTPAEDTKKPTATSPLVTALPDGSALVEWSTNEATTGSVSTGRSAGKLSVAAADSEASRTHSLVVTGLAPGASYWIQTASADVSGNVGTSKAVQVTTPAAGVAEQQTASFRRGKVTGAAVVDPAGSGAVTLSGKQAGNRQGTFTSGLLDAQAMVDWDRAVSRTVVPKGSALELRVRTGSTASPDSTWSSWKAVSGKDRVKGSSRFLQYQVTLTSRAGSVAPELRAVGFTANGGRVIHEGETR